MFLRPEWPAKEERKNYRAEVAFKIGNEEFVRAIELKSTTYDDAKEELSAILKSNRDIIGISLV